MANNKLFVRSLSYTVTDSDLMELFSQAGTVASAKVIMDRELDRSKGFGFVEMNTDEEAAEAMRKFEGYELKGRAIAVAIAKPMPERTGGGDRGGRPQGGGGFNRNRY